MQPSLTIPIPGRISFYPNLQQAGWDIHGFHAIVGRGGLVKPIESGIYEVNDALAHDLEYPVMGEHASNLGGLIARDIVREMHNGTKAYIADPVVVDELDPIARLSGHPAFPGYLFSML